MTAPDAAGALLDRVAYHEAGHAVLSCLLRIPFRRVTIRPRGDAAGRVTCPPWPSSFQPDVASSPRATRRVESEIVVFFGGYLGERERYGEADDGWSGDREKIAHLISYIAGGPEDEQRRLDELLARAGGYLRSTWPAVEAIAQKLLEVGSLSAVEARRIYLATRAG